MLKVGDTAPDFTAATQDGDVHLYGLLSTGPVILYFYNRDFTPACTAQAKKFRDMKDDLASTHAHVVGVSPDGVEEALASAPRLLRSSVRPWPWADAYRWPGLYPQVNTPSVSDTHSAPPRPVPIQ